MDGDLTCALDNAFSRCGFAIRCARHALATERQQYRKDPSSYDPA